jgi:hypothetical protein
MPTPPNSPAARKRHKAQTAPPAKQPLESEKKGSVTPHTTTLLNKEGNPVNYVPETPAAKLPEAVEFVQPVTEKKSFFRNLFNK